MTEPTKKRGRRKNTAGTKSFNVTVPTQVYQFLGHLARNTFLGASENEVAAHILKTRVTEIVRAKEHELEIPEDNES